MPPGDTQTAKTRKPHRKTRNGCQACKARHVKCDERKPSCLNCERYKSNCEYPRPRSTAASNATLSPRPPERHIASASQSPAVNIFEEDPIENRELIADIGHLRLMHHYTTVTAKTLAHEPAVTDLFSIYMPKIAFDNLYLLHAILSLTALHLARSEPSLEAKYLLQARRHHQIALTQFRSEVNDITDTNMYPVLSFNQFIFPYLSAISTSCTDVEDAFNSILSSLVTARMIAPLIRSNGVFESMRQSEFRRLIPQDVYSVLWDKAEAPVETELSQLRRFSDIIHHVYTPEINEAYKEAIRLLELIFDATSRLSKPPSDSLLRIWLHLVPPRFVELLSEKQPGALIIFAHYGVALGKGRHYWFLEGIDELILTVADAFVPKEWKNWLDWPKEKISACRTPHSQPT